MQNERNFLVGFVFYQRFGNHSRKAVYAFWRQAHIHIYSRQKNVDFLPPKPLTKFLRRNIISSLCGHGGTGRRVRLRGVWETVWVQVPSTAPSGKQLLSTTIKVVFLCFQTKIQVNQAKIKQNRLRSGRSAVTDGMGGAILFSMIAGIGCIVYAADNRS